MPLCHFHLRTDHHHLSLEGPVWSLAFSLLPYSLFSAQQLDGSFINLLTTCHRLTKPTVFTVAYGPIMIHPTTYRLGLSLHSNSLLAPACWPPYSPRNVLRILSQHLSLLAEDSPSLAPFIPVQRALPASLSS